MTPRDTQSPEPRGRKSSEDATRAHRSSGTESQSAYLRERHRDDAKPGDASADVQEVRDHPAASTRSDDSGPTGRDAAS